MPTLAAKPREITGKKVQSLRREGFLPVVLYGENVPAMSLAVSLDEFRKTLKEAGETSLVSIAVEGGKTFNVLIHDVAKDPLTLKPIHADFYAVRMDKPIEAKIPLAFTGESAAVKNEGGILVKVIHELPVSALPKDLPHEIEISIEALNAIGAKIHVRDIAAPQGVTIEADADEVVALIEAPRSEAELEELAKPEAAEGVEEVKTEREIKAEAKAAEEAATEEAGS
ncbi:50S ribosomal protein L25 [Candidatus Parcubacteria bacterium]|nr:MAG: 50S ribosomal protein L25 [Candidatus Parcubacteria bacterium]